MQTVNISKDEIFDLLKFDSLHKTLHDDEEICPICHGLGMVITRNQFGIGNDKIRKLEWFDNQSLSFCNNCYNGVIQKCKYCGKPFKRGYSHCDCEEYKQEQQKLENEKYHKVIERAKEVSLEECKNIAYFYCEETERYYCDIDEMIDDVLEHDVSIPKVLWLTTPIKISIDAYSVCESACEDLHEDALQECDVISLQILCDEWCNNQKGTTTYYPDYDKYIKVKDEWFKR